MCIASLMTCEDCQQTNIRKFDSCRCPESNYAERLPMTPSFFMDLSRAEKALGNNQAHICRPLINLEQGWRQIDEDLLVESHAHMTEPALLSNAVLVCNYGGIIRIREVPEKEEATEEETLEEYIKEIMTTLGWTANDEVSEIKEILEAFGITDRISIACFLLICISETDEYALGYTEELREMPWQSAAWRWAVVDQTKAHSLNAYIRDKASENDGRLTLGMLLTAECFINGQVTTQYNSPQKISENPNENYNTPNNALAAIASGELPQTMGGERDDNHWHTEGGYLYAGGWRYMAPNNWDYFMNNYYILFPEEERWQIE